MKIEICERCGKPGDYPECTPPYKPRRQSKLAIENEALQSRVAELEVSLENAVFDMQYLHDMEAINKRAESALRKIAYEIPTDISGDEAATMCEEIASEFFGESP